MKTRTKKFNYLKQLKPYLRDVAKKSVAPGGGSAGALICSLGISLIQMSAQFSLDKNKKVLTHTIQNLEKIKLKIVKYIDLDANKFKKAMDTKNKEIRRKFFKELDALAFDIGNSCVEVLKISKKSEKYIKVNIKSDFRIGLEMVRVSMFSAVQNMETNLVISGKKGFERVLYFKKFLRKKSWPLS